MQPFIEEFDSHFPLQPPEGCADTELYCAIKISQICRPDAFGDDHPFHQIGNAARQWLLRDEMADRLSRGMKESCGEMRRLSLGVYVLHQFSGFLDAAIAGSEDQHWSVRATVCEVLHDLGLRGKSFDALCHPLLQLANYDSNFIVRSTAVQALRFYPSEEVIAQLHAIAEHDHECSAEFMVESAAAMAQDSIRYIRSSPDNG